jgi:hypothetical protein
MIVVLAGMHSIEISSITAEECGVLNLLAEI